MGNNPVQLDKSGSFFKWKNFFTLESKIVCIGGTTSSSGSIEGGAVSVLGISFPEVFRSHIGKKVRVTLDVLDEK